MEAEALAEDGGKLGEQLSAGDDARSVALSGLHLPCSSISEPRNNLDHVDGQKILRRKCCKSSVELIEGLFGVRVRMRLSWMMTPHQLRTVDPAVEPLRAGTIFGMLFLLEKLASRISSHVELSLSQHDRGVVAHTKKFFREDKGLPGEVSCFCTETQLLGAAARRWFIFLHCSHVCGPIVLIENRISISIECEGGIEFGQLLARKMVAIVARSEKQILKKARLRCGA